MREEACIAIPLFNHGKTVRAVAERALACGFAVIVVDDGSTDNGAENLAGLELTLVSHEKNLGKGAAILTAAKEAARQGFAMMVTVDADGQLDPAEAGKLTDAARREKGPVMVIGARRMEEAGAPGSSLFGRKFSNFWVHLECGLTLPDTQSGMRLYPVAELLSLPVRSRRYGFEVEVISRMAWAGIRVVSVDVGVVYPPDRISHFHRFVDNMRLSFCHARLVLRAICPWPHQRLAAADTGGKTCRDGGDEKNPAAVWLHPAAFFRKLCLEHTSAWQLAAAAWIGVFLGAVPLLALHTVAIIYVTHRLHLNKLAAVGASQLCMPPVVPVLCVETGYWLRHGTFLLKADWDTVVGEAHLRLWEWLLGSLIIGPVLGTVVALAFYLVIKTLRRGAVEEPCG